MNLVLGLAGPVAVGLVLGTAVLWDRWREPRRDITRPTVVVDRRTYRDAVRRVDRLVAVEDWSRAHAAAVAICTWLGSERHYGRAARRAWMNDNLDRWTARAREMRPF